MRAGAQLVVVDPRPTREARAADLWLQPRPASDAALALAVLNVIVTERLWDEDFVSRWTHGFEGLRERVAPFAPEETEAVTGVPPVLVRKFARLYAETPAAALSPGTPNGQGRNALNLERALCILIALTGKLDRGGCNRLLGPTRDAGSEVTYDAYEELSANQRARRLGTERFRLHGEGVEILSKAASRVWYGIPYPITRAVLGVAHPLAIFDAIDTGQPYPVRALLIQHHNPIGAYNGSARIARTLVSNRLELLVVHDLYLELLNGSRIVPGTQTRRRFEELDPEGRPYGFGTPTQKVELSSTVLAKLGYDPLPDFDDLAATPDALEQFPLRLMTGATRIDATHQDHRHVERLRKRHPDPIVDMDPATAAEIGVVDGDWVRIVTSDGEIHQRVRLVPGLGADRVSAERWWYPERDGTRPTLYGVLESNVNAYTGGELDRCDPVYGGLPYREARCRVERAQSLGGRSGIDLVE
jgi:anaerobic selenocysteine-containing dehydrogenase